MRLNKELENPWAIHKLIIEEIDELKGFYDPIEDIKCRQTFRHIVYKGKLINNGKGKIKRAKNPPPLSREPYNFKLLEKG